MPDTGPAPDLSAERRSALIIATGVYADEELARLRAPARDAEGLAAVLGAPDIGAFGVTPLEDRPVQELKIEVADFLSARAADELLVVYLSCHGVLDARGLLYFAASDTIKAKLPATGLESQWLLDRLDDCRARRQVLILDCCFSGAFAAGARGEAELDLERHIIGHGRGRVVLTASRAREYSFEGVAVPGTEPEDSGSFFTTGLVEGLRTGGADDDHDGLISVEDAYNYAYNYVQDHHPAQTPQRWMYGAEGHIWLARNPNGRVPQATPPGPMPDPPPQPPGSSDQRVSEPPPQPPHQAAETPQASAPKFPFSISWTGKEPLSGYTGEPLDSSKLKRDIWTVFAAVVLVPTLLTVVILAVPVALGKIKPAQDGQGGGWFAWFVMSAILAGLAILFFLVAWLEKRLYRTTGWSLYVGPDGITTAGSFGKRQYPWKQVTRIAIEPIQNSGKRYSYEGLHVQIARDAKQSRRDRPAGWPRFHPGTITDRAWMVPICVLGPMSDEQRAKLEEAIAQYGGPDKRPLTQQFLDGVVKAGGTTLHKFSAYRSRRKSPVNREL